MIPIRKNNLTALARLAVLDVLSQARRLVIPIQKNNLTALARLAVLSVLSSARRLVSLLF